MLALAPFTSHPYDMGAWITHQLRPFNAGLDPFFNWKFSAPMLAVLLVTHPPAVASATFLHIPEILSDQFWIKVPFIAAHLILAVLLGRFVWHLSGRRSDARFVSIVWLLNPVAIFYTAVHGQIDALAATLMLLAILSFTRGSESAGLAAALGAAAAKYVGFVLVPFAALRSLHRTDAGWATLGKITAACLVVIAAAFGPGLLADGGLLGGLQSSVVQGAQVSEWSIWSLVDNPETASPTWAAAFLGWYAFVLWRFARSDRTDPLNLVRGVASTLAMLVALDPFANPHFIIWVMPLALLLAFIDRSGLRLGFLAVIGLLNMVTLFGVVEPIAWFLNAVPDVHTAIFDTNFLTGTFNPELTRLTGFGYALALMSMAVFDALTINLGVRRDDAPSVAWRLARGLSVAHGVVIATLFMWVTFQPALLKRYADAPSYPVVLGRVNSFSASRVAWTAGSGATTLRAEWPDAIRSFAAGHIDRGRVLAVSPQALPPVVSMTGAALSLSIGQEGVTQSITLPYVGHVLRVDLLLGNPTFGLQGAPPLPSIRVRSGNDPGQEVEVTSSAEYAVVPGWFLVHVALQEQLAGRTFTVEVSAPQAAGWTWNGEAFARGSDVDTGNRWIEVWATPDGTDGFRLTEGYQPMQLFPLRNSSSLEGVSLEISEPLLLRSPPAVSLELDIRQRGRPRPLLLVGIGAASAAYLALFILLTIRVIRWGVDESQADLPNELKGDRHARHER